MKGVDAVTTGGYGCFYALLLRLLVADVVASPAVAAGGGHNFGSCCGSRLWLPVQWYPRMRMQEASAVVDGEGRRQARRGLHQVVLLIFSNKLLVNSYVR